MKKTLQTLTFAAVVALTLLTSTTVAFAMDSKHARETAWTDLGDLPDPITVVEEFLFDGVTWEE